MGSLSPMRYLVPLLILCTIAAAYDEANCEKRSSKLYYTSICDLPLGGELHCRIQYPYCNYICIHYIVY